MILDFDINKCKRLDRGASGRHPFSFFEDWTVVHNDGFVVRIAELWQHQTYECILTGYPREIAWHIDFAVRAAKHNFPNFSEKPLVLSPVIACGQTHRTRLGGETEIVEWEMLPQITSIALLETASSFEYVLVIWFQDRIGLPGAEITQQIKSINWGRYACECNP